jgi:hypothetical protein
MVCSENVDNWGSERFTHHHLFSSKRETLGGWTRLAMVSFRPVVLDFGLQDFSSFLYFWSPLLIV